MKVRRMLQIGLLVGVVLVAWNPGEAAQIHINTALGVRLRVSVESAIEQQFEGVVLQQWDASCGSAALATVLTFLYHDTVSEDELVASMSGGKGIVPDIGFSMLDIKTAGEARGYRVHGFKGTTEALSQLKIPVIVLLRFGGLQHFVVVRQVQDGRVNLADPALGNSSLSTGDFQSRWNGVFLVIEKPGYVFTGAEQSKEYAAPLAPEYQDIRRFTRHAIGSSKVETAEF